MNGCLDTEGARDACTEIQRRLTQFEAVNVGPCELVVAAGRKPIT